MDMRLLTRKIANWEHHYKEIDVASVPFFSANYRVFCGHGTNDLQAILTVPVRDYLSRNPGWCVEATQQ